jgi:hypothetical protein
LIVFVARDHHKNKAYKVPEMNISEFDDSVSARKAFEIGLTIKDWSRDKA